MMRDHVIYRALDEADHEALLRFMLGLDAAHLRRRFNVAMTARAVFAHFNSITDGAMKCFAATQREILGLVELYGQDEAWSSAELVLTTDPRQAYAQMRSELVHLALLDLARRETRDLILCRRAHDEELSPYFDGYEMLYADEDIVRLAL